MPDTALCGGLSEGLKQSSCSRGTDITARKTDDKHRCERSVTCHHAVISAVEGGKVRVAGKVMVGVGAILCQMVRWMGKALANKQAFEQRPE